MKIQKSFLILTLILCALGCSSDDKDEMISIEGTEWISLENGTTGDAKDITSGKQAGTYFRVALSGIDILQTITKNRPYKYSGIYKFDYPNFVIEADNGAMAKYNVGKDYMTLVSGDNSYNNVYFPKKMYLCIEGESTYRETSIDIFTGKTWYMTYIAIEGQNKMYDFWQGDQDAREKSFRTIKGDNYTLVFEGAEINGTAGGAFSGKATSASVNGDWSANGDNRELKITIKNGGGTDGDKYLGKAFMDGLKSAFKYGGDSKNLYIYYKEGQTVKFISFAPQRNSGN